MRRAFVAISKALFNFLYRLLQTSTRGDEVVFLSRQANEPSYDFTMLAREFEARGWTVTMHMKKVTKRNLISYAGHVLKEIRLLARCKFAVLDRYDPVVSLLDFECEPTCASATNDGEAPETAARSAIANPGDLPAAEPTGTAADGIHSEFPVKPVILQLWHAFGAYKKFGYQSIGTAEGHAHSTIELFNIHRNYSWIACSCESARAAYAEAFAYPIERVVVLPRPEFDELLERRASLKESDATANSAAEPNPAPAGNLETAPAANGPAEAAVEPTPAATPAARPPRVLMAPTLRRSGKSEHPFRDLYEHREQFEAGLAAQVTWSFHPLEEGLPAPGNASDDLMSCDIVVTDYSSIVYEAYMLGKRVVFYISDLEKYLLSPGLNANPAELCPSLCAFSETQLAELLETFASGGAYPANELAAFAETAFDLADSTAFGPSAASRIVDFAIEQTTSR